MMYGIAVVTPTPTEARSVAAGVANVVSAGFRPAVTAVQLNHYLLLFATHHFADLPCCPSCYNMRIEGKLRGAPGW